MAAGWQGGKRVANRWQKPCLWMADAAHASMGDKKAICGSACHEYVIKKVIACKPLPMQMASHRQFATAGSLLAWLGPSAATLSAVAMLSSAAPAIVMCTRLSPDPLAHGSRMHQSLLAPSAAQAEQQHACMFTNSCCTGFMSSRCHLGCCLLAGWQ